MRVAAITSDGALRFEGFRLDPRVGLSRWHASGKWTPIALGSRAADVLRALAERRGDLVTKQALMDTVWPGVAVEDGNLAVQISTLRRVLDEGRGGTSCIQTVIGRGYRFLPTVTVESDPPVPDLATPLRETIESPDAIAPRAGKRTLGRVFARPSLRHSPLLAIMTAVLIVTGLGVIATGTLRHRGRIAQTVLPRLSIVVLPFENLSGVASEDYLADAITEDLTTDLSRVAGAFVIARQSAYTYRGKTVDIRNVGEELGVRYVLEGSVRKLGDALRVNAQLVAAETGAHLWAERLDQPLKDLGAGQEEIVRRVGRSLNVALIDTESARSRRERPTNPDAFDLILRARSLGLHPMGSRAHAERISLFEQALRLDPRSIVAMTGLATELTRRTFIYNTADDFGRAAELISEAATIDPNDHGVLEATAFRLFAQGRYAEAASAYQRELDEFPNADAAYNQIGLCLIVTGRAEEAIPMIERAIRLNPRSPYNFSRYENMGMALLLLGRDEDSIVWQQRALAEYPDNTKANRAQYNVRLAAAYARLGHLDQAHRALAEANRIWPYDTVRSHWPDDPSSRVHAAQIERYQSALRLAGHRDHAEEDTDSAVASDDILHAELVGLTPTGVPGATTIRTAELQRLLVERKPIVIDSLMYSWGRSIPGTVGLTRAGWGGTYSDEPQDRLRRRMQALTKGDLAAPIVAVGFNSERFDGRNLALRLVALGYTQVYWYRGGREAWEVAGLPETEVDVQEW